MLPFVNQGGDADDEYFSDGMTDELASALMKVPGLRVAARSSAYTFKGRNADAREVGASLKVTAVLEGTVRRAGSKLRVTAQLVNANDGLAIWSERYERDASDVFRVQDDITGAIVTALRLTLGAGGAGRREAHARSNAEAHDLYLRGRFLVLKQTEDGLRKGLDYFGQALAKDPNYAPAYAGMAFAWAWLADAYMPPREAEPKAKAAALEGARARPVEHRGPHDAGHHPLDSTTGTRRPPTWSSAGRSSRTPARWTRTTCMRSRSAPRNGSTKGCAATERAIALDPLAPMASWARANCLATARRYDEAIEQHRKTGELDPNFYYFDSPGGLAYREKGMYPEAVADYLHVRQATGQPVAGLAVTYAKMGRTEEARAVLSEFLDLSARQYVSPEQVAMIYASLGERDQAFAWLERAYEARSAFLVVGILTSPAYDPLRADPRFAALVKKMGIQ